MVQQVDPAEVLEVTIGEKTYRLGRIGFFVLLGAEEEIRKERRSEFRALVESLKGVESDLATKAIASGFDHYVRNINVFPQDVYDWLDTASGELYALSCSLKFATPGKTHDAAETEALELLRDAGVVESARIQNFLAHVLTGE